MCKKNIEFFSFLFIIYLYLINLIDKIDSVDFFIGQKEKKGKKHFDLNIDRHTIKGMISGSVISRHGIPKVSGGEATSKGEKLYPNSVT